jgi:hypothetical protein
VALVPGVPQVIVEVAFTNNPLDSSLTWTDISAYVTGFTPSTPLGRQHQLNRSQPTSYTVTFTNRDGRFTPTNTTSPYYHSPSVGTGLVPRKPIRIRAVWPQSGGTTYTVARGFVDKWVAVPTDALNQTATARFTDWFKIFNSTYLDNPTLFPNLIESLAPGDLVEYHRLNEAGPPSVADSGPLGSTGSIQGGFMGFGAPGLVLYDPSPAMDFSAGTGAPSACILGGATAATDQTFIGTFLCNPIDLSVVTVTGLDQTVAYFPGDPVINANQEVLQILDGGQMVLQHGTFSSGVITPTGTTYDIVGPGHMDDGMPHWWAVTIVGTSPWTWTLWVDGVSYGSISLPQHCAGPVIWGGVIGSFGGFPFTAGAFNGVMQDLASWGLIALTGTQIQQIFTTGSYLQIDQTTGLRIAAAMTVAGFATIPQNLAAGTMPCAPETSAGVQTTSGAVPVGQQLSTTPLETAITQTLLGDYIMTANDTENGFLYQDQSGVIQFKDRHYPQLNATTTTSQATSGDNAAATYHYDVTGFAWPQDDQDLWPIAQVQRNNGLIAVSADSGAVTAFGPVTYELSGLLFDQDFYSAALAQWITYLYAWPLPRVSGVTLSSKTNAGVDLPIMLGLNLWDSITLQRQGPGETQVSTMMVIESIAHTWDATKPEWTTTLVLSPFEVSAKANAVLIVGDATRGTVDSTNVLGG